MFYKDASCATVARFAFIHSVCLLPWRQLRNREAGANENEFRAVSCYTNRNCTYGSYMEFSPELAHPDCVNCLESWDPEVHQYLATPILARHHGQCHGKTANAYRTPTEYWKNCINVTEGSKHIVPQEMQECAVQDDM